MTSMNGFGFQGFFSTQTLPIFVWSTYAYIAAFASPVASKVCVKRTEIGNRRGNLYICNDSRLSECCEREESFTCCEPEWEKILVNQIWLVSTLLAIFLALVMVYVCYNRQEEVFESPTARQAALRLRSRAFRVYSSLWKKQGDRNIDPETSEYESLQCGSLKDITRAGCKST